MLNVLNSKKPSNSQIKKRNLFWIYDKISDEHVLFQPSASFIATKRRRKSKSIEP